jgi:MscS family membrane protein
MRPRALPRLLAAAAIALSLAAGAPFASAQPKPAPAASASASVTPPAPPPVPVAPDSPRASVKRFLDLCNAGEYGEAASYLDLPEGARGEGPELARRLKAVLDRQIWIKLDTLSPESLGNQSDLQPAGVEEIGTVRTPSGPEPVRLVRRRLPEGVRWVFTQSTVARVNDWYGRLRDRWLHEHLPRPLLRAGPHELLWWQWIALPLLFVGALLVGRALGFATRKVVGRVTARTETVWDDALLARLGPPLAFTWALVAVYVALPWIGLYPPAVAFMERLLRAGALIAIFWFGVRGVDVAGERVVALSTTQGNAAARSLVPLGAKAAKVAVIAIAAVAVISELGYPVASLVAGLGIGGVAVALAAQKTVENLFGSLSIGVDQPFRVGDYVTVDTISGTVESIGLRSTRIRTLDRTLVTIPNGKLADMRVESFAERDKIRFTAVLGLSRDTSAGAVREVLAGARALLREHPKVAPDPSVSLVKIGEASLDVEVSTWFLTTDANEFAALREEALIDLLAVVERAGARLAMPERSVRVTAGAGNLPGVNAAREGGNPSRT